MGNPLLDIESAAKQAAATGPVRAGAESFEMAVLEAIKTVLENAIPAPIRPFVVGLVDGLAEKGIAKFEAWTDAELQALGRAHAAAVAVATSSSPAEVPLGLGETSGDFPTRPE